MHGLLGYGFSHAKCHRFPMDQREEAKQRGKRPENDLSAFISHSNNISPFSMEYLFSFNTVTVLYVFRGSAGPLQGAGI